MAKAIYEAIGRGVVSFVRIRYRRQIRVAAGASVLVAAIACVAVARRSPAED
jgi:hypothetical protein